MPLKSPKAVQFKAGGETYSVRLGFAAICRIEQEADVPFPQFIASIGGNAARVSDVLTVFHAMMLRNGGSEPFEDVTKDEAAALVDELGFEKVVDLIGKAVEASPLFKTAQPVRGAGA